MTAGSFVWYELMTTDRAAATAFYQKVVGWGTAAAPAPHSEYTILTAETGPVGGLMTLPETAKKAGAPPHWVGYVEVDDVDAAAARATRLGGGTCVAPTDIENVGRFAVVTDPQKAAIALFKAAPSDCAQPTPPMEAAGRVGWRELHAADGASAFGFYGEMFGWQKGEAMDMGPGATYQIFLDHGVQVGGMFTKPPQEPVPYWLYYFNVGDIDAAKDRVTAGGGKVLNGPMEVPGGQWILQAMDPQGAMFALVAPKR